jgi:hypothetical protein
MDIQKAVENTSIHYDEWTEDEMHVLAAYNGVTIGEDLTALILRARYLFKKNGEVPSLFEKNGEVQSLHELLAKKDGCECPITVLSGLFSDNTLERICMERICKYGGLPRPTEFA